MGLSPRSSETIYSSQDLFTEKYFLNIDDGLVTLITLNNPLGPVLDEISRRTGEKVKISPALRLKKISVRWKGIPLEEGIEKIAGDLGLSSGRDEDGNLYISEFEEQSTIGPETNAPAVTKNITIEKPSVIDAKNSVSPETDFSQNNDSGSAILLNEVVIRFKQDISEEDITQILADSNITVKKYIAPLKYHILSLPEGMTSYDAMVLFKKKKMLYQAEPDYLITVK